MKLFILSVVASLSLLIVENVVGINWDFHPDAVTYTTNSYNTVSDILDESLMLAFNNFYYFIAAMLGENVFLLIVLNVLIFAITNTLLQNIFEKTLKEYEVKNNIKLSIFFMCIYFMPYRLHLAIHVLKDTIIIFFMIQLLSSNKIKWFFSLFFLLGLRLFSAAYVGVFVGKKYFYVGIAIVLLCAFLNIDILSSMLIEKNDTNMTFRDFDMVPNFSNYGLLGVLIRALVWPILAFTGTYIIFSPSIAFAPLALGSISITFMSCWLFKKPPVNIQALFIFALIALLTTGYTTYIRYCFPLLVLIPVYQFKENLLKYKMQYKI